MPVYKFRALDSNDNIIENTLKAFDNDDARQSVLEKGYTPIKIEETVVLNDIGNNFFNKVKLQNLVVFCRQLAIIIKSGINITAGLDILRKQSDASFKKAILQVDLEVQKGRTLAQAMRETDLKFPELLIKMISTGEVSGNLDSVLDNMGDYYEKENYIKQKIKSALIYPIILITVAIGLLCFFTNFILPSMEELLSGQQLPFITRFVIGTANVIVSKYTLIIIAAIIILGFLSKRYVADDKYRKIKDAIILKTPIIGGVVKEIITYRFLTTLYLLIKSGMDIVNVLEIVKKIMSNYWAENTVEFALDGIKRGEKLGDMLSQTDFFEPLAVQMIGVGEETGELEKILNEISIFYGKKLELKIERLVSMMEPVFTVVIGGLIGIVILSMATPMFSMVGGIDTSGGGIE